MRLSEVVQCMRLPSVSTAIGGKGREEQEREGKEREGKGRPRHGLESNDASDTENQIK